MDEPNVTPATASSSVVSNIKLRSDKPQKTGRDWVRDMRMSANVNKSTVGVETEQVTPDLLVATTKKLLGLSRNEIEPDPKDSLEFQRFYGPSEYFAEHVLRDGNKLGRNMLWKATNRGNLDFIPTGALDKHISDVFYDSKLAQMMDGSSPLETIDSAYKTTRIGEGGVSSLDSAPEEMRAVQPSFFGYIDPVRCFAKGTELMTSTGWKAVQDIKETDKLACLINGRLEYHKPSALHSYDYNGELYGYDDGTIGYLVTPNHRMYSRCADAKRDGSKCAYNIRTAESIHGTHRMVNSGMHLPVLRNEDETVFHLPKVEPDLKHSQVHGMPPQGANLKNIDDIDIVDFAEYMGWYLSEGCFNINDKLRNYIALITQSPTKNRANYIRIKNLIERLPFNATCPEPEKGNNRLSIARKQLVMYLKQFGKSDMKFIPEWIFEAPLKARLAFREAMLLGDGRDQRHLCTMSKQLAEDFARLQFELGESVFVFHEQEKRIKDHPGIWVVYWHTRRENGLQKRILRTKKVPYYTKQYKDKVYCPTVPGGLVYSRMSSAHTGFWIGQSPESFRVGLDVYMTKNVQKGSDGKLYQKFINARTGKEELVDSETAAKSVIASNEMMDAKTKSVFAIGGPTGIHIVNKKDVDYYLPRADEAYSASSNMVTMPSGVISMRLQMGCLHPLTTVLVQNKRHEIEICKAQGLTGEDQTIPGCMEDGTSKVFPIVNTIAKFVPKRKWFKKIVLRSGRTLITSVDHRWPVLRKGQYTLLPASKLKAGDIALRSMFKDVPSRKTFINGVLVNKDIAAMLGFACRSFSIQEEGRAKVIIQPGYKDRVDAAMKRLGIEDYSFYTKFGDLCLGIKDVNFIKWLDDNVGDDRDLKRIPSAILSAGAEIISQFINAFTSDTTQVGIDSNDDIWILNLPNDTMRDSIAFLMARLATDTLYRDSVKSGFFDMALKLVEPDDMYGDMVKDEIKAVKDGPKTAIMIDIDIDDNLYAVANGTITHNSKYPLQAISLVNREAPLVRGLDEATGKDMPTLIGKYLGARFADRPGVVTAVRKDRIDVLYDNGEKGSVALYNNFPMNAKGYIHNKPVVKAGQAFKKGDILASSNYTDDKGVSALGTNLRSAWMSWKGGTYEDAVVISESAAKKLTSTTMYKTAIDLDRTVSLGKNNYVTWKPSEFNKEQLSMLDDSGVVKPGSVLTKDDPMILAVQTTEPSPGTMGKRVLTDVSERWEHDYPGIVTDVVKTRKGVKVFATITAPAEVGDKISGYHGNKGEIAQIIPDDQMPRTEKGEILDVIWSPLGIISRCNSSQLYEALLGKIAKKTGKPEVMPAFFKGDLYEYVSNKLKENHISPDENIIDPETGKVIPDILTGITYTHKLKHLAESKMSARGTSEYTAEGLPGGKGFDGSKRFGSLEQGAMVGHGAFKTIEDAKILRGQSNADFWRSIRTGSIPTIPGEPLVHKKFFAHLTGSGINVRKTPKGVSVFSLSNQDVKELAGPRELKSRDTYEIRTFRPIDGGLFGQDIFGINGDKWAYIQLDEPVPNPIMEEPLARLLNIPEKTFVAVAEGRGEYDGMKNAVDLKERLSKINLNAEAEKALKEFKSASPSNKDKALKRYRAIEQMRRSGISPAEYMLDRIPVLPPEYRPVSTHNGLTMVADSNYLYAQLLDARDDMREAKNLPDEYKAQARENLYKRWKELTGLYDPENIKLKSKHVQGLLKWALGDSPKFSSFQRKVLSASVDTVGRGVIVPNSRLKLNQVGIPENMAFGIMAPFVERALVQRGYTPIEAMKQVKEKTPQAKSLLLDVMKTHPVLMNRAPSLHKLSIMGFEPVIVAGHAIHVNPSIVVPFGADFDGDQVNIHAPVSDNAREEVRRRMFPERNLVGMRKREILYKPEKEYQQGLYFATKQNDEPGVTKKVFGSVEEARKAYRDGLIRINDPIEIRSK